MLMSCSLQFSQHRIEYGFHFAGVVAFERVQPTGIAVRMRNDMNRQYTRLKKKKQEQAKRAAHRAARSAGGCRQPSKQRVGRCARVRSDIVCADTERHRKQSDCGRRDHALQPHRRTSHHRVCFVSFSATAACVHSAPPLSTAGRQISHAVFCAWNASNATSARPLEGSGGCNELRCSSSYARAWL